MFCNTKYCGGHRISNNLLLPREGLSDWFVWALQGQNKRADHLVLEARPCEDYDKFYAMNPPFPAHLGFDYISAAFELMVGAILVGGGCVVVRGGF